MIRERERKKERALRSGKFILFGKRKEYKN